MHASRWLLGVSAITLVAAGGLSAGCSSSSAPPQAAEDASMDATGGSPQDAPTSCHVDASLAAFAASDAAGAGCAACVQTMCASAIEGCSSSCPCIDLFSCLADAGVTASTLGSNLGSLNACVPGGIPSVTMLLMDPGISGITNCLSVTCSDQCANLLMDAATTTDSGGGSAADAGGSTDSGSSAD